MTAATTDSDRDVVPRWRSVRRTAEAGEFQRLAEPRPLADSHIFELERFERTWRAAPSDVSASEFLGAAIVAGDSDRATDATKALDKGGKSSGLVGILTTFEDSLPEPSATVDFPETEFFYKRISALREHLRRDPRDPIAWADLGRRYTSLGQFHQAEQSLNIARALAPESRYLLRVASKFLVHIGRPDDAYKMLRASARTRRDPWLMAAVLATASIAEMPIRDIKVAKRIAEDANFRPIERSELTSELATLELRGGADRRARQAFRRTLQSPTDNALAQVQWASRRISNLEVPLAELQIPFAAEANARAAADEGRWSDALGFILDWLDDQPFETDAAILGSYAASVGMNDWTTATQIARMGLRAKPGDLTLLNNLAYALTECGLFGDAATILDGVSADGETAESAAMIATRGLLAFRTGIADEGRTLYAQAIEMAIRTSNKHLEAMARVMLLREELTHGWVPDIDGHLAAVSLLLTGNPDPGVQTILRRIDGLRSRHASPLMPS